jgi:nitrile hydratase
MSGHEHDHDHASSSGMAARVRALVATLESKGILSSAQLDGALAAFLAGARPENGAAIVARAWVDPAFFARLLSDASAGLDELGIDMSHWARVKLRAVANTDRVHNVIVCTLCSCYPVGLLGPSPAWYKSAEYRARVVREPRAVLEEFGVRLEATTEIRVWDSTADLRYIVIPRRPAGTEGLTERELAARVTRDALVGTAICE